jgi:hypothetical protein
MRLKPPKAPSSRSLAGFGGTPGPLAEEGIYTVRLTRGKNSYEAEIELVMDPDLPHSAEDRAKQREIIMRLYRVQEDLAYYADALKDVAEQIESHLDKLRDGDGLKKDLDKYVEQVADLRQQILITEDVQGIPGLAQKLRDRVVFLYTFVSMYWGRPSDSQIKLTAVLEDEVAGTGAEFSRLTAEPLQKLNARLEKEDFARIELITRSEYENSDS